MWLSLVNTRPSHLLSNLHGRIGINDNAIPNYHLDRQDPHDIDPKNLKLLSVNDIGNYHEAEWAKINGEAITLHCGAVNAATTGEDWALMQRFPNEEVAIRRLMAMFNEDGHQFFVSTGVLQMASKLREGIYRCIKSSCPTGPLAPSTPTAEPSLLDGAVVASPQIGNHSPNLLHHRLEITSQSRLDRILPFTSHSRQLFRLLQLVAHRETQAPNLKMKMKLLPEHQRKNQLKNFRWAVGSMARL
ncbi:hypothetical protein NHQ30_003655 [Ciborinia camelliae]|nr:hypothetical protein NHQ30_003655 [Ciborinia camelliae]